MKNPFVSAAQLFIHLYQKTISPDHSWMRHAFPGGFCKYQPTCSQYMDISLEKYGLIRGLWRGIWRIVRCNPFSKGGLDLP